MVLSSSVKVTVAISLRYTAPFSDFTTKFSSSSGVSISPNIRMLRRWPEDIRLPAESVILPLLMAPITLSKLTFAAIILYTSTATSTSRS